VLGFPDKCPENFARVEEIDFQKDMRINLFFEA
jgi:hypothetical protein